ncbi:MAG TPA: alpha/beta hydrolase-fold protein [Flavisolibacter sp.]|nr:alpha/beta hydrolase-fold protein [Flavisolibacter sp.]
MKKIFFCLALFGWLGATAAGIDTASIHSKSMNRALKCVVIVPEDKKDGVRFPVVYLLHGHGGAYHNWIRRVPQLASLADQHRMIIVCPDAAFSSWYFDSPIDSSMQFETYIAKEVPAYIDNHYPTIKGRSARAITGLSMGGHGGLFLGFRHAGFFGACGSMSGALMIENITKGFDVEKRLGDTIANRHYYRELSIMKQMEQYPKDSVAIVMDCGTEDFVIEMSRAAHRKMLSLKIPHDYTERPGKHDWKYWGNAIEYQLLFFRRYFDRAAKAG